MPEYEVEFVCQHVEIVTIKAKSKKEAREKVENGEYGRIIDWHLEGNRDVQSVNKITKEEK